MHFPTSFFIKDRTLKSPLSFPTTQGINMSLKKKEKKIKGLKALKSSKKWKGYVVLKLNWRHSALDQFLTSPPLRQPRSFQPCAYNLFLPRFKPHPYEQLNAKCFCSINEEADLRLIWEEEFAPRKGLSIISSLLMMVTWLMGWIMAHCIQK